jgi:hypothetical protein
MVVQCGVFNKQLYTLSCCFLLKKLEPHSLERAHYLHCFFFLISVDYHSELPIAITFHRHYRFFSVHTNYLCYSSKK